MKSTRTRIALALGVALGSSAQAMDFALDDGAQLTWKTNISLGQSRRAADRDPKLLQPVNAGLQSISGGTGGNTDDSDLNYDKNKPVSTLLNLSTEAALKKGSFGAVLGIRAWKDYTLENDNVSHGSFVNGYRANAPLKDTGFEEFAKFSGAAVWNAYVYNSFQTGYGDLNVKFGRHVLNWGAGMFVQGVNQINALDLNAVRAPGLDPSDWRLPQGMLSAKLDLGKGKTIEGFYQFQFQNNVFPGCGTFFLPVDASVGPNTQNACASAYVQALPGVGDAGGLARRFYIPPAATRMPSNGGQFGLSMHFPVEAIASDVGVYAMDIASRNPILNAIKGNSLYLGTTPALGAAGSQSALFWEYPEHIKVFGLSAKTKVDGWAIGSELSYVPNFPVVVATGDLVAGLAYTSSPAALAQLGIPGPVAALMNANPGPLAARFNAAANGQVVSGYDSIRKTQFQVNAAKGFKGVAGADLATFAGEVAVQHASVPSDTNGIRYGRAFVFGIGTSPAYNLGAYPANLTQGGTCPFLNTTGQAGCANDGFVTPWSWGYRLRGQLTYANAFNSGLTLKPTLSFSSDEKGYSADGQFNKGRRITTLSLIGEFAKYWTAQIGYTTYNRSASWDPLRDRDYYSASVKVSF